ncbi:hypothetical protein [Hymenobacter metallicola]|uniref:Uncharacterized protein n=1 Tax=Hymenobacter metallicola TaxID=2563114 RepID=A0A4Z0QH70_9BACT|nr:hypothetical protein [Hymenobacter metallicola]TGE29370.1 hypothetical protein E5K02_07925 [Hymenobacter metallicola]
MLQPKNLLMKRGALLGKEPRVDRKVFTTIGFSDFASAVSIVFSEYCFATVSDSETVFLCPLRSSAAALKPLHNAHAAPKPVFPLATNIHLEPRQLPLPRPTSTTRFCVMDIGR